MALKIYTITFGWSRGALRFKTSALMLPPPVVTAPTFVRQTAYKLHITWGHITGGGGTAGIK